MEDSLFMDWRSQTTMIPMITMIITIIAGPGTRSGPETWTVTEPNPPLKTARLADGAQTPVIIMRALVLNVTMTTQCQFHQVLLFYLFTANGFFHHGSWTDPFTINPFYTE